MISGRYLFTLLALVFALFGAAAGIKFGTYYVSLPSIEDSLEAPLQHFSLWGFAVAGALLGVLVASLSFSRIQRVFGGLHQAPVIDKIAGAVGCLFGMMVGAIICIPLLASGTIPAIIMVALLILFGFVGASFALSMKDELWQVWGGSAPAERASGVEESATEVPTRPQLRPKILDTNVIIDGRIADICSTRFVEGIIYVPGFVLEELQHIADSADSLRRARGRRGLVMLKKMQDELDTPVEVSEDYPPDYDESEPVDVRLVKMAKHLDATIITNDFNLNKVAQLHGVPVMNVNELANALKPVFLPGEQIEVELVKLGKEPRQGVGYLDDGTMVVVENGDRRVGQTVVAKVTSVLQTIAGKMIFAELESDDDRDRSDRASHNMRPNSRGGRGD